MAQKIIDTTTPQPNGKIGDTAKVAFGKVNDNFAELYASKANATHTHAIADVSGLQAALDGKIGRVMDYSPPDANSLPTGNFLGNLASGDTSNTPTGSWTQIIQSTNWNKTWGFQLAKPWFQDELYLRSFSNGNWSNWFRIWHSGNLTGSLGFNGYQKLPGGLILQWMIGHAGQSGTRVDNTFPIAFPSACFGASAVHTGGAESVNIVVDNSPLPTATTIGLRSTWPHSNVQAFIIAIGN